MDSYTQATIEDQHYEIELLKKEIKRLKDCAERTAKSEAKTITVELPSEENGYNIFVTAPHLTNEETLAKTMMSSLEMLAYTMGYVRKEQEKTNEQKD